MDSDKLEQMKENVKPLREGRTINTLMHSTLSDDTNAAKTREETKIKYEHDLKTLNDKELFEAYYSYVHWIEQNYPNSGKESNLSKVLEECIQAFYKHDKYRNDERMLTLFLKYVNLVSDALNVFEFFYKVKFGRKLALFYINWSYQFEMQNNFKKALNVIKVGIKNEAEPMEDLKRTLNDIEVRTMRFVSTNPTEEAESHVRRKALFSLKAKKDGHGKVVAPIERNENAVNDNAGLKVQSKKDHNAAIKVFQGTANVQNVASSESDFKKFIDNRENVTNPDKWSENKLKLNSRSNPVENFEIFVDSNAEPTKEADYPIAYFEDKEKLKRYMWYPHIKEIYRDHTEYSFEELRYQKWLRTQKEQSKTKPELNFKAQAEKSLNTTVVRAFFNEPLTTTINDMFEKSKSTENLNENFDNENVKNQSFCDVTICTTKLEDLESCSSSTPHMNKTFNRLQNLRAKSFHNPNFVNGITSKLSTIVETSREEFSKSSSSSSSATSGTMSCINGPLQKKDFATEECINPFDNEYKKRLLASLNESVESRAHFTKINMDLPSTLNSSKVFIIDPDEYSIISEQINSGDSEEMHYFVVNNSSQKSEIVKLFYLKICKNLNYWEFYIYDELKRRLIQQKTFGPDIELSIFTADTFATNNSYIVLNDIECDSTLKQMIEKSRQKQITFPPTFILITALELLVIIKQLHECYIIHSNICLENIIFNMSNSSDIDLLPERTSIIKLLNFSRAIDLKLLPNQSVFSSNHLSMPIRNLFATMDIKSWSYEIDWIGLMNVIHLMVFGCDMKIECFNSKWKVTNKFKNEYSVLDKLFEKLLEAVTTGQKPILDRLILQLTEIVKENKNLTMEIYEFKERYLLESMKY